MREYFENLNNFNKNPKLNILREFGVNNDIPIITTDGLSVLLTVIRLKNVKKILEIGTAIGYSSIYMALEKKDIKIDTIERDLKMYNLAVANIKEFSLENQINVIFKDALEVNEIELGEYDLIFIDAAKAQYRRFFEKYTKCLKKGGVVFTDNLLFHGLVESNPKDIESRNVRALTRKIDNYNSYLSENKEFVTTFIEIGDGIALSVKR